MRSGADPELSARIALIGCGTLGRSLGQRLLTAGHPLAVHDDDPRAATALAGAGATTAGSPAEAAEGADYVITCLPGPDEVFESALGPRGFVPVAAPGTFHVETSTVGPACVRRIAADAASRGLRSVDAPVSRGARGEADDVDPELVLWVGAAADHYDLARPVLERMAERVVYCGGVGVGQTTKLVNNLLAHTLVVLVGEALALGVGAGASLDVLASVLRYGTGQTRMLDELFPASVFRGDFRPGLRLDLALKDLDLAAELARERRQSLIASEPVRALFEEARRRGWGQQSAHAVVRLIEERYGVRLRSLLADADGPV